MHNSLQKRRSITLGTHVCLYLPTIQCKHQAHNLLLLVHNHQCKIDLISKFQLKIEKTIIITCERLTIKHM